MADYREAFIGIDVAKLRNAIAIAEGAPGGRGSLFRRGRRIGHRHATVIQRIAGRFDHVHFYYEADPTVMAFIV